MARDSNADFDYFHDSPVLKKNQGNHVNHQNLRYYLLFVFGGESCKIYCFMLNQ